jgi:ABC-type enterochelin transport system substrate-binding protein
MTGEEMERAIEFLLQGQANHQVRLDELAAQVAETSRVVQLQAETQTEFIQIVTRHIEAQGEINASLRAAASRTDEINASLRTAASRTDERIDRLEILVERYLEGRGDQA